MLNTHHLYHTDIASPRVVMLEVAHRQMKNFNYLIVDPIENCAVIVDPAWQLEKIEHAIELSGARLKGILITHSHPDHINLAAVVSEKYHCPIWMSRIEIDASGYTAPQLEGIEEMPWYVGSMLIEPIFTPGHTTGCVCYRIGKNLFTGDVLFAEGCGLCPNTEAAHTMFDSLNYLKSSLDPDTRIFPGHSYGKQPGQLFSHLLENNIYLQFPNKVSFAAFRLRSGQSRASLFNFA